jgi:transposase-like protein
MIVGHSTVRRRESTTMAERDSMTMEQVVRKVIADEHADVLRESVRLVAQQLMECEVSELIGAGRGERNPDGRLTQRNGYRSREWDTRAGVIDLEIPKLRQGSYFPHGLLEASRRFCRSCSRRMCAACRPGGWTSSSRRSGCGSRSPR